MQNYYKCRRADEPTSAVVYILAQSLQRTGREICHSNSFLPSCRNTFECLSRQDLPLFGKYGIPRLAVSTSASTPSTVKAGKGHACSPPPLTHTLILFRRVLSRTNTQATLAKMSQDETSWMDRDLFGYGPDRPDAKWPKGAKIAVNCGPSQPLSSTVAG